MIEKVQTSVLLIKDLRDLAKARNVSISGVCNSALASVLSVPTSEAELIASELRLNQELASIHAKRTELSSVGALANKKKTIDEMRDDVDELRGLWVKRLKGEITADYWAKLVSKFCELWKVDRITAIRYAQHEKDVV